MTASETKSRESGLASMNRRQAAARMSVYGTGVKGRCERLIFDHPDGLTITQILSMLNEESNMVVYGACKNLAMEGRVRMVRNTHARRGGSTYYPAEQAPVIKPASYVILEAMQAHAKLLLQTTHGYIEALPE
jgi:hypothetical protein